MNDELQRLWKEVVIAYFKVLSLYLVEGTDENLGKDSQSPSYK